VKLIKRKDISALVNACARARRRIDFRYIVQYAKARQPIQRLWLQSMTPGDPRRLHALAHGRRNDSARRRGDVPQRERLAHRHQRQRAMTAFNPRPALSSHDGRRVQTPTLAILASARRRLRKFVSRNYWEIHGTFGAEAGEYAGRWFDENFPRRKATEQSMPDASGKWRARKKSRKNVSASGHRHGSKQADDFDVAAAL